MGRTLKRVPLDFDWPIRKTWDGYLNSEWGPCPETGKTCFNGYTAAGKWVESIAALIALIGTQASESGSAHRPDRIYPHPYLQEFALAPRIDERRTVLRRRLMTTGDSPQLVPLNAELHQFCEALAGREIGALSGVSVHWQITRALKEAAGVAEHWGFCPVCEGDADDPAKRAAADAWRPTEPPEGEGFQLWETTSEGSPISPVFTSSDELFAWCAEHATVFGKLKATADEWKRVMLGGSFFVNDRIVSP